jgi:hypothetical protein
VHRTTAWIFAVIVAMPFGNAASAQNAGASIDAGALNMRYADSVKTNAVALTPAAWLESSSTSLSAAATLSQFTEGGWSAQGSVDGSLFTRRRSLFLGEFEATAGGSAHKDGAHTGQVIGTARAHFANDYRGVWIGGGAGGAHDGTSWRSVIQGEAAAWARVNAAAVFLSITPAAVADSVRFTDSQLSASLNLQHVELIASAGYRSGSGSRSWGSGSVTAWIASRIAIVASAGTYPIDFTQGFPGGRFASLSIRFGTRRFPPSAPSVTEIEGLSGVSRGMPRLESRNLQDGVREIRLYAPNAENVELMADFTRWETVKLGNAGGGWWSGSFRIPPGIHELNVRLDGGRWIVPRGLDSKADEFGGSVGVLIVE